MFIIAVMAVALATTSGCATRKPKTTQSLLTQAGFKTVLATTPLQQQQLETLAVGQVSPVNKNGQTYFVYPDRATQSLFVGQEPAYRKYQKLMREQLAAEDARLQRASQAENEAVERAMSDKDSTPGFEGPGGFDF